MRKSKMQLILVELGDHLPYSIFGVVSSIIIMGILTYITKIVGAEARAVSASRDLFHLFHPSHILFSAIATTAMFWKHDNKSILKAALVGFFGSVTICGISDIFFPFLGGLIAGSKMHLHVCIIEEPYLIYPFAIMGVLAGFSVSKTIEHSTQYSHGVHVFLSSFASLLYLISYGMVDWMHQVSAVFFITIFAVMVPCCLSDIVFPIVCTHKYCEH